MKLPSLMETASIEQALQSRLDDAVAKNHNIHIGAVKVPDWFRMSTPYMALLTPM